MTYEETAVSNAHKQALTAEQVRAMSYKQIAQLAGLTVGPGGETPADFFYSVVREAVANILAAEEVSKKQQEQLSTVKAWLTLTPSLNKLDAYPNEQGEIVIR